LRDAKQESLKLSGGISGTGNMRTVPDQESDSLEKFPYIDFHNLKWFWDQLFGDDSDDTDDSGE